MGSHATFAPGPDTAATEVIDGAPVRGRVHDENAASARARWATPVCSVRSPTSALPAIWQDEVLDDATPARGDA